MSAKVEGIDELLRQIGRISDFPKDMRKELRTANRKIGQLGARKIKPDIPKSRQVFKVRRTGERGGKKGPNMDITPGTLRRSIGVRNSRGSKINVFLGPRSGGVSQKNDGWFAGIVESGHVSGRGKSVGSPAYNKLRPALARYQPVMARLMVMQYRKIFDKFKL